MSEGKLRFFEQNKRPVTLIHGEITAPDRFSKGDNEQKNDNVGTEAADKLSTETVRAGKNVKDTVKSGSNQISKQRQKQIIKKQYYARSKGKPVEDGVKATAEKAETAIKKAAEFAKNHKKGAVAVIAIFMMFSFLLNGISSCSVILNGIGSSIAASTYPSEDSDMLAAEAAYCAMENELKSRLDNYESTHGYDEYHFDLDDIYHDPYVLISIITSLRGEAWKIDEVGDMLQMLFDKQYILTETVTTDTRYRMEAAMDENGNRVYNRVQHTYYICTVTLDNFNLSHVPVYIMSQNELSMYAVYMSTLGNRPDLFQGSEYVDRYYPSANNGYTIPPEALNDEIFKAIITEAEKYLGFPYVWGGTNPSTSFDCSGYVSWVFNNCGVGWNFGRLGVDGLLYMCTLVSPANARPGDLIFFERTYDETGATHVGIYVGNGMMIHCGDPIRYVDITTEYWKDHFYCFGRMPMP